MIEQITEFNILHICDYSAPYRGNFIDSLQSIERFHDNIRNYYLFPNRAWNYPDALRWINELNKEHVVAYIQEEGFFGNMCLFLHIIRKHKICRIVRHFSDIKIDILVKLFFRGKHVIRFFHSRLEMSHSLTKHYLRKVLWKNNKLVGVSESVTSELRAAFPEFYVISIHNAVNFDRLDIIEPFQSSDVLSLMMMGWDPVTKGVDLALKACEKIQKKYGFVLRIIGGRDTEKTYEIVDGILGEKKDWIQVLSPTNNIGTYFLTNDIFLSPSRHEAFGYANVEAVYCENSIVLTKVGGQAQLQIEGAYWVEPNDVDDLAEKLESAIIDVNKPERALQRARVKDQVMKKYSLENWSNQVVDLLFENE